jgi:hypothetical protein
MTRCEDITLKYVRHLQRLQRQGAHLTDTVDIELRELQVLLVAAKQSESTLRLRWFDYAWMPVVVWLSDLTDASVQRYDRFRARELPDDWEDNK